MNPKISACIVCFNEKANIRECLESVKWCDEIIVVDSGSTDGTVKICREYTERVIHHKWPGFVKQKNYALSLACPEPVSGSVATNDWVISIDADEIVSAELQTEIKELWEKGEPENYSGFYVPRKTFYLGKWIMHGGWYPDYKLRIFKKSQGKWDGIDPHDKVVLSAGETKKLKHPLIHKNYLNLSDQLRTINSFSSTNAKALLEAGKKFSLFSLIFRPPIKFIETYFFKFGFLDGLAGLIISINSAFYVFNKYAKMWEAKREKKE